MGIKKYIFFATILIVLCGLYVFTFQDGSYSVEFFGVPITLKIAIWVILPMVLLTLVSVFHLIYYYAKISIERRALLKDYEMFIKSSKQALLGKEFEPKYKTQWFLVANDMLSALRDPKKGFEKLQNDELKKICEDITNIQDNEFVNLKPYKLEDSNPLAVQNKLNELSKDPKKASEILRDCPDLQSDLCKKAFDVILKNGSFTEIRKYKFKLSAKDVANILKRNIDKEDDLFINEADIDELINDTQMNKDEYLEVAKILKKDINPDTLVTMFERIFNKDNNAGKAYIYILIELQMLEKAQDVLDNSDEDEYEEFKTYLFLREKGQKTDLKLLVK